MRKRHMSLLVMVTLLLIGFVLGFSVGKSTQSGDVLVSVPGQMLTEPMETEIIYEETTFPADTIVFPININTAEKEEFMALPGIGEILAERILNYRLQNGDFSHETDLLNVEGIGHAKMEAILDYITTGG